MENKFKDLLEEAEALRQEYWEAASASDLLYFADSAKDFIDEVVAIINGLN